MKQKGSDYFTKADGKKLEARLMASLETKLETKLEAKLEAKLNSKFDEKLNEIRDDMRQWHSDIFDLVDGLASEVKDNREFREITTNQIIEDRVRIGKLEKKVFGVVM